MKSRFRFRVWDKENSNSLEFEGFKKGNIEFNFDVDTNSIWIEFNHNKYILEQCTGLKDKNGKLIYEGDIIKINTWFDNIVPDNFEYRYEEEKGFALYQIFFNQEKARFEANCIKYTKVKPYRCFLLEYGPTNVEVIGNIHENKDLIERTTNE